MKREKAFTRKVDSKTGLTKVKLSNREDYWAFEDGKVRLGDDDVLQVYEEWFDGDMGLWWEGEPYVFIGEREHRYFLDDIMKDAGFVQGDKESLQNPVVLHHDRNFRNFASRKKWNLPVALFNGSFSYKDRGSLIQYSNFTALDYDGFSSEEKLCGVGRISGPTSARK